MKDGGNCATIPTSARQGETAMSSPGAEAERPLRFFENREKYLFFVTAGGEI